MFRLDPRLTQGYRTMQLMFQPIMFHFMTVGLIFPSALTIPRPQVSVIGKFQIGPIIVGRTNIKKLATKLASILDNNTLMVISSDLSHFLSYTEALNRDRQTIDQILSI
jgi:predicted class III extradiol MEMO1 family dioxygenase